MPKNDKIEFEYMQTKIKVSSNATAKKFIFELTNELGAGGKLSPLLSFLFEKLRKKYEQGGIEAIREDLEGLDGFQKSIDRR